MTWEMQVRKVCSHPLIGTMPDLLFGHQLWPYLLYMSRLKLNPLWRWLTMRDVVRIAGAAIGWGPQNSLLATLERRVLTIVPPQSPWRL